jgi:hypothetical protein
MSTGRVARAVKVNGGGGGRSDEEVAAWAQEGGAWEDSERQWGWAAGVERAIYSWFRG